MLNNAISIILVIVLLSSTITSVYAPSPLSRAYSTEPVLKDQSGRELFQAGVGEVILVESVLTSGENHNQSFAYIVQIKDAKEFTVQLSWMNGVLHPKQELKASQSWLTSDQGDYSVTIFVWESVYNPWPLGPAMQTEISVLPQSRPLPFDFNISSDPSSLKIKKGRSSELTVAVEPMGVEKHNVRLMLDDVPHGINVELGQDFKGDRPPYTLPVKISIDDSIILGTYYFDIVGESGAIHRSVTVKVMVVKEDL